MALHTSTCTFPANSKLVSPNDHLKCIYDHPFMSQSDNACKFSWLKQGHSMLSNLGALEVINNPLKLYSSNSCTAKYTTF